MKVGSGAAASLERVRTEILAMDALLNILEARVAILQASWSGEARDAYADAHRSWEASIRRLLSIAAQMQQCAAGHVETVGAFDRRRAAAWQ